MIVDESGALLAPLVRRSQAPRGCPPVLRPRARQRDKISLIGALCVSPDQRTVSFHYDTLFNAYYNNVRVAAFLEQLLARLAGHVVVLWDGGNMHKGDPIRTVLRANPRLWVERLPPYAPELSPTEGVWSYTKYDRLVNFVPAHLTELHQAVREVLEDVTRQGKELWRFFGPETLPLDIRELAA